MKEAKVKEIKSFKTKKNSVTLLMLRGASKENSLSAKLSSDPVSKIHRGRRFQRCGAQQKRHNGQDHLC